MSDHIIHRTSRIADSQATLPWLMACGIYLLLTVMAPRLLADPDTYSHLALGHWILSHHTVPTVDSFSWTMRGEHWVAFEWLSEIAYAGAQSFGGWVGVQTGPTILPGSGWHVIDYNCFVNGATRTISWSVGLWARLRMKSPSIFT